MNKEFIEELKRTFEEDSKDLINTSNLLDSYYKENNFKYNKEMGIYCGWDTLYREIISSNVENNQGFGYALRDLFKNINIDNNVFYFNKMHHIVTNVTTNEFKRYIDALYIKIKYEESDFEMVSKLLNSFDVVDIVGWEFIKNIEMSNGYELKNLFKNIKNINCDLFHYDKNKKELRNATDEEIKNRVNSLVHVYGLIE